MNRNAALVVALALGAAAITAIARADEPVAPRELRFPWCPSPRAALSYAMDDPADQHRIVLLPGVEKGGTYPVVFAFHGQPSRDKAPRDYWFPGFVEQHAAELVQKGAVKPFVLVLPVFRFQGGNWPYFNPAKFKKEIAARLEAEGVAMGDVYAFGHSGAAGCGGGGLNQAALLRPKAVGFFDTCLGDGWKTALRELRDAKIRAIDIRSVETAGFSPRQTPEYQAKFDFGRAYEPEGLARVKCPVVHPGEALRQQPWRCAATKDGLVRAFVVDTGEGEQAHHDLVAPAMDYFLEEVAGLRP
jgi:hypothetical protein